MKNPFSIILLGLMILSSSFTGTTSEEKKIQFMEGTFQEALELAKKEKKPIFIDAYTDWCHWCKVLDKKTFSNDKVVAYMNENFINLKMDMESREGQKLGKKFRVSAYPTLLFIGTDEKSINRIEGFLKWRAFLQEAKYANKAFKKDQTQ